MVKVGIGLAYLGAFRAFERMNRFWIMLGTGGGKSRYASDYGLCGFAELGNYS